MNHRDLVASATHGATDARERIQSLDFIRGVAVLGMLVANVPWLAGDSMSRVYDPDPTSVAAWLLQYLVFDQRFMPLFAMLFGASLYLLSGRYTNDGAFYRYFLRRMAILFCFGVAHAYLLWPGDILITYSVCGPILLLFRRRDPWTLITFGVLLNVVNLTFGQWPDLYYSTIDRALFSWWVEIGEPPSTIVEAYAGSYLQLLEYNAWRNQFIQWTALPHFRIWNSLGLMLIGMGLFRLGVLQGLKSKDFYRSLLIYSLTLSAPLVAYGVLARIGMNESVGPYFGFTAKLPLENITFRAGCAVMSLAIIASVHLGVDHIASAVRRPVEAIGRMALTNYLFHSVFFLTVFHGLKLFPYDSLDHDALLIFVVIVWTIQLALSRLWLKRFRQGPIERLWRLLSGSKP